MRLEMADFPVKEVHFSQRTGYQKGVLEIDKQSLLAGILEDSRIQTADLDLAVPGERTRVINIRDAVEPRCKVTGEASVFPGIMGPVRTVGEGRTHRLSGMTIMVSAAYPPSILAGTAAQNSAILDMWGPGADISPFGATLNLILILKLVKVVTETEAHSAIMEAQCRLATRLAEATRELEPEQLDIFELFPTDPSLPKVVYNLAVMTMLHEPHSHVAYYGMPIQESLATFMHPNELMDGAVTTDARRGNGGYTLTWHYQNLPVVYELYREHGQRLNFLGVILQRTRFLTEFGKQVTAEGTSQMARLLGADAVILTRTVPSGNNFMDAMITLQAYEDKGIKTVLLTPERGGTQGTDMPLLYYLPGATAMVSTGSFEREIELPSTERVIGFDEKEMPRLFVGDPPFDPYAAQKRDGWRDVIGGIDWFGGMAITCKEY